MRSARRVATAAGSAGGGGGFGAAVFSGAGGGDATDGEERGGVGSVVVATGGDSATAGVAVGEGARECGLVRLRRTTTGFVFGLGERAGMAALFPSCTRIASLSGRCSEGAAVHRGSDAHQRCSTGRERPPCAALSSVSYALMECRCSLRTVLPVLVDSGHDPLGVPWASGEPPALAGFVDVHDANRFGDG
jgi:hypothetical protein